ncbi:putative AP-3 complex subunit mu-2-like protein, partial [Naja naja]
MPDLALPFMSLVAIPVYVKHNISSLGRFEITVGPKQTTAKTVEGVLGTSQTPKGILNVTLTPSRGHSRLILSQRGG